MIPILNDGGCIGVRVPLDVELQAAILSGDFIAALYRRELKVVVVYAAARPLLERGWVRRHASSV
jgi:hypothetical protein